MKNQRVEVNEYMIKHKTIAGLFICLICCLFMPGCKNESNKKKIVVGISYQNLQNEFILGIQDAVRKKAKELNIELLEADGQGKAENQISQVENFISRDVNAIILNPFDKNGCSPAVDLAIQAGIPIIILNATVSNVEKANAYVGSDDTEAGRIAAEKMLEINKGKGDIMILHGPYGHSAEVQRTEGMKEVIKKSTGVRIVFEQTANWDRAQGLAVMENFLSTHKEINVVLAQNDEMALGAYKAIEAAGKEKQISVIGIDAIPDALRSVKEGKMAATVFQDAHGQGSLAVDIANELAHNKKITHSNNIPFQLVTKENVSRF